LRFLLIWTLVGSFLEARLSVEVPFFWSRLFVGRRDFHFGVRGLDSALAARERGGSEPALSRPHFGTSVAIFVQEESALLTTRPFRLAAVFAGILDAVVRSA